jgi:hypothetical protein
MKAYFQNDKYINQSLLKLLLTSVELFNNYQHNDAMLNLYYKEKTAMINGSAVDTLLTTNDFHKKYYISNLVKKPSDTILSIIKQLFDEATFSINKLDLAKSVLKKLEHPLYYKKLEVIIESHNYYNNLKLETKLKKVYTNGSGYWEDLCLAGDRQILSLEEFAVIEAVVISLKNNIFTQEIINPKPCENISIFTQKEFYDVYQNIPIKGLMDFVKVDEEKKTVSIYDLKITEDYTYNYIKGSYNRWKHGFQGVFYFLLAGLHYKDYAIENPYFIVESAKHVGHPRIFQMSDDEVSKWLYGTPKQGIPHLYEFKSVMWALDRYKWHLKNGFETDKELINGIQEI